MAETERGVLLLDDRRVIVAANEAAAVMLGSVPEELIGRRADEFMPLVARQLYPLAWKGFLMRRSAAGEYAAQLPDGSLSHLAYVGFANRPIRGLHFFVLEALPGPIDKQLLRPRVQPDAILIGSDLPEETRQRLIKEADRQEWRLPLAKGARRAVVAALFDGPDAALDVLKDLREYGRFDGSIASAAGATPEEPLTLLAGHVAYSDVGGAVEQIRARGGRVLTNVDERWAIGRAAGPD